MNVFRSVVLLAFALTIFASAHLASASEATYKLAYKCRPNETIYSKVTHLVTVETKIRGTEEVARTRSISTKLWRVKSVAADGKIVFEHLVDHVDMWQTAAGGKELKYNSDTDKLPPAGYEPVADSVGKVLATITINPAGRIVSRENTQKHFNPGIGELTVPLPEGPARIGEEWFVPDEVQLRLEDGAIKKVAVRQLYRLQKVETGVATIVAETQVLTPIDDPKLRSQLVQRMQKGVIKFDLDAGRLISKQMDLDESVLGFNGADSHMQYQSRFTEEAITAAEVTARKKPAVEGPKAR